MIMNTDEIIIWNGGGGGVLRNAATSVKTACHWARKFGSCIFRICSIYSVVSNDPNRRRPKPRSLCWESNPRHPLRRTSNYWLKCHHLNSNSTGHAKKKKLLNLLEIVINVMTSEASRTSCLTNTWIPACKTGATFVIEVLRERNTRIRKRQGFQIYASILETTHLLHSLNWKITWRT